MKLFLAGNFPLMSSIDKERGMRDYVFERGEGYNRLASFFYKRGAENMVELKRETEHGPEK